MSVQPNVDLHHWATLACLWEATARKAGNVHPGAGFADLTYTDFVLSAVAIGPAFSAADRAAVGRTVLRAVEATRCVVSTNTNLGIILLLAPLAKCPPDRPLPNAVADVLAGLTVADARDVYAAIRLAQPGGIGEVPEQDIRHAPTLPLREVMALARDHDLIARQYFNGFREVLDDGLAVLLRGLQQWGNLEEAIIGAHLELIARFPDSLIVRKCGLSAAQEAGRRARAVLDAGWPQSPAGRDAFAALDGWLRGDGNRRNPGTSADLVTACIFAALRDNSIRLPITVPWSRG
jgi:triphosphoribosyl-dephospho-CoA synthase